MVTAIKLGLLNVLVRTHSFITRYIKPLFRKARKKLLTIYLLQLCKTIYKAKK